jgi:hypothetical protein
VSHSGGKCHLQGPTHACRGPHSCVATGLWGAHVGRVDRGPRQLACFLLTPQGCICDTHMWLKSCWGHAQARLRACVAISQNSV